MNFLADQGLVVGTCRSNDGSLVGVDGVKLEGTRLLTVPGSLGSVSGR